MIDDKYLKNNIYVFRKSANISQEEMAARIGVCRGTFRGIESGDTELLCKHLAKIADVLGIDVLDLILGTNPDGNKPLLNEDQEHYSDWLTELKKKHLEELRECQEQLKHLQEDNENLQKINLALHDLLDSKDQIISMMKRGNQQDEKDCLKEEE